MGLARSILFYIFKLINFRYLSNTGLLVILKAEDSSVLVLDFKAFSTKVVKRWMDMIYEVNATPLTYDELMEMLDFLTKFGYFDGAQDGKSCNGTAQAILLSLRFLYF